MNDTVEKMTFLDFSR